MGILDSLTKWLPVANFIGDIWGANQGANSAAAANRTNIQLARENRDWQAKMDNTAIQRRVADITAAGGNPALAFTNGGAASTPSVASPTVEPTFKPEWTKGSTAQAALLKAQVDNLQASTANTAAQAARTRVQTMQDLAGQPYWDANAKGKADQIQATLLKTTAEIGNLNALNRLQEVNYDLAELDYETQQKLAPLRIQAQALLNASTAATTEGAKAQALNTLWDTYGKELDSAEKRAAWKFWNSVPASKWIQLVRQLAGK